jgi:glutaredoxin-like protein
MIIGDREKKQIAERLKTLANPVRIVYFTQEFACDYCRETGQLMRELSELSDKIGFEEYNFQVDRDRVIQYEVDKIPATVIMGQEKDYGIRFYGVPLGYEFVSVLEAALDVSRGDSGLKPETRQKLKAVDKPVRIQVLVTPT